MSYCSVHWRARTKIAKICDHWNFQQKIDFFYENHKIAYNSVKWRARAKIVKICDQSYFFKIQLLDFYIENTKMLITRLNEELE